MFARGSNSTPTGKLDANYRLTPDTPHLVGARGTNALPLIERPHFGLRAHELAYRYSPPVREANERIARDALAQVRHHRLFLDALLDPAIELRERDHRHLQFPGERLEGAR